MKQFDTSHTSSPHVIFRDLDEPELTVETGVVYRADNRSEALRVFLNLLEEQRQRATLVS